MGCVAPVLGTDGTVPSGGGRLGPKSSSESSSEELLSEELASAVVDGGGGAGPITLRRLLESSSLVEGREGPAAYLRFSGSML